MIKWFDENCDWLLLVAVAVGLLCLAVMALAYAPLQPHWNR